MCLARKLRPKSEQYYNKAYGVIQTEGEIQKNFHYTMSAASKYHSRDELNYATKKTSCKARSAYTGSANDFI